MASQRLGDTLRDLRNAKGWTQQQAADMLGLKNKSTLGSWEIGKSEPDGYTLLKLCKIYDVADIYEAFGEVSPKQFTEDKNEIYDKYEQLNDEYKKLIRFQIDQLLQVQEEYNK